MSTKFEKQVSLPSGNSTKPRQATAQQVLLETTTNNLENTTNNNKEMDTIINNNSNNNINVNSNVINNNCNNTNTTTCNDGIESKDEVDFVRTKTYPPPTLITSKNDNTNNQKCSIMKKLTSTNMSNLYNDCEVKSSLKSSLSTLEKFSFFTLGRNHKNNHHHINNQNQNNQQQNSNNNNNNNNNHLININLNNENNNDIDNHNKTSSTKQHSTLKKSNSDHQMLSIKHKFGKSASIARLLGHTYNTKKVENELLKYKNNNSNCNNEMLTNGGNHSNFNSINKCEQKLLKKNFKTNFGNNTSNYTNTQNRNIERFQMCTNNEDDLTAINLTNLHSNNNTNNSNNYNTSTSYNNYNTKNKTKLNQTKQNSINNNNNINSNCNCISQNEYKNNSNFNENKSHNNNKCNCNNNNNNDNNNNKTQISNNNNNNMNNNSNGNNEVNIQDFQEDHYNDISAKAFRTISRSLGKLWWKRTHSVEISAPDPEYKVSYLGNVLTGWAKGEGCVEKPLNTLWRNYSQNHKPDVIMRVRVCASGLKATTRQHGLTEYWANRITHCCSPKNYPKVFCWIYRHEGRKLKHELRCHAILCSKESIAQEICNTLRENLDRALHDFKREKILKQNARLSLANSVYENPSLPRRKILLSVGGNNYRPPMERSKSAPKLMAIEEAIGEEEGEEIEQTNEPEMPSCCQKDSLYPAMTLGRRRCRRGHSIRRTGKAYKISFGDNGKMINLSNNNCLDVIGDRTKDLVMNNDDKKTLDNEVYLRRYCHNENNNDDHNNAIKSKSTTSLGSDDDDLEKLLSHNNYDTSSPLAGELLSYFDMKLNAKTSSLTDLSESINNDDNDDNLPNNYINNNDNSNGNNTSDDQILYEASLTTDPCPRPRATLSLENLDNCCDGCESDCNIHIDFDDEEDELYYRQTAILNLLHRNSMRKLANLSMSSDDSGDSIEKSNHNHHHHHHHHRHQQHNMDSDEGSISSGCETASTVTANCEDTSLKYINDDKQQITNTSDELTINNKSNSNNSNNNSNNQIQDSLSNDNKITEVKISNKTLTFMRANHLKSPKFINNHYSNDCNGTNIMKGQTNNQISNYHSRKNFSSRKLMTANTTTTTTTTATTNGNGDISDSEFSDESGYVEFQDQIIPKRKSENEYHHNQHLSLSTSSTSSSTASMITTTNQYTNNNSSNKKN